MTPILVEILSLLLLCSGCGYAAHRVASDRDSQIAQHIRSYLLYLDAEFAALLLAPRGTRVLIAQTLGLLSVAAAALVFGANRYFGGGAVAIVAAPFLFLRHARKLRRAAIEANLNAFNIAFANALKTTPSIGKALIRVQDVVSGPMADELALTLKELRLGTTVEQALLNLSARVQSTTLDVSLSGVLIGRQVGGPIPAILERTAATFREMERLHGLMRAKTSEGKGQVGVMALAPPVIVVIFDRVQPGYFEPLFTQWVGLVVVAFSVLCWLASIVIARRILAVEV